MSVCGCMVVQACLMYFAVLDGSEVSKFINNIALRGNYNPNNTGDQFAY